MLSIQLRKVRRKVGAIVMKRTEAPRKKNIAYFARYSFGKTRTRAKASRSKRKKKQIKRQKTRRRAMKTTYTSEH